MELVKEFAEDRPYSLPERNLAVTKSYNNVKGLKFTMDQADVLWIPKRKGRPTIAQREWSFKLIEHMKTLVGNYKTLRIVMLTHTPLLTFSNTITIFL